LKVKKQFQTMNNSHILNIVKLKNNKYAVSAIQQGLKLFSFTLSNNYDYTEHNDLHFLKGQSIGSIIEVEDDMLLCSSYTNKGYFWVDLKSK